MHMREGSEYAVVYLIKKKREGVYANENIFVWYPVQEYLLQLLLDVSVKVPLCPLALVSQTMCAVFNMSNFQFDFWKVGRKAGRHTW